MSLTSIRIKEYMTIARTLKPDLNQTCDRLQLFPSWTLRLRRREASCSSIHRQNTSLAYKNGEDFLQCLFWPLTFSTFLMSIFPMHHGLNPWEKSGWVRSHTTDQTTGLIARQCEACQCLLSEKSMGLRLVRSHCTFPQLANQISGVKGNQYMAKGNKKKMG